MTALPGRSGGRRTWRLAKEMTVKRIRIDRPRSRRDRGWLEALPADPRDPDVIRAKALARARLTGPPRSNRAR
jgi:hypothetical protein